ncbi:MAG: class I SAM-dependent methyltransferase [Myxococcota bacterium]
MSEAREWRLDDAAAEYFEAHFVPAIFATWAPILVDACAVSQGQRVLDVACGTGIVARVASDCLGGVGEVTGLDLNPSMIKVARRLRPDLDWREGDATEMPFPDASFDAVLCQAGLMFFPDPIAALREMRRVLAPDGQLAIHVWGASEGYELTAELLDKTAGKEIANIFRAPFSMAHSSLLPELLAKAGFDAPRSKTYEEPARFPSIEAFLRTEVDGWVLKGRVDIDALIPGARERLEPYVGTDGGVAIPMAGHVATCSKI